MDPKIDKLLHHADYSEKMLEKYLIKRVKETGGLCFKHYDPTKVGYPDRIVFPSGDRRPYFVELKSRGKKPTLVQKKRINELLGHRESVYVCDSKESIDRVISLTD